MDVRQAKKTVIRYGMRGSQTAYVPDYGPNTMEAKPEKTKWKDRPLVEKVGIATFDLIAASLAITLVDYLALHGNLGPVVQGIVVQAHGQYAHAMQFAGQFADNVEAMSNGKMTFEQLLESGRNIGSTVSETNPDVIRPMAPFWEHVFDPLRQ